MGEEDIHISAWDLKKNNIRSVILDRRQRLVGCSSKGERSAGLSSEGRDPLVTQAYLSAPRVYSPAVSLLHKKGPRHRRKLCAKSLSDCIPTTHNRTVEEEKLYFYISTSFSLFVKGYDMWHTHTHTHTYIYIYIYNKAWEKVILLEVNYKSKTEEGKATTKSL